MKTPIAIAALALVLGSIALWLTIRSDDGGREGLAKLKALATGRRDALSG